MKLSSVLLVLYLRSSYPYPNSFTQSLGALRRPASNHLQLAFYHSSTRKPRDVNSPSFECKDYKTSIHKHGSGERRGASISSSSSSSSSSERAASSKEQSSRRDGSITNPKAQANAQAQVKGTGGRSRASKRLKALTSEADAMVLQTTTASPLISESLLSVLEEEEASSLLTKVPVSRYRQPVKESKKVVMRTVANLAEARNNNYYYNKKEQNIKGSKGKGEKEKEKEKKNERYVLGCGVEALSPENLMSLIKSTAPYLFPDKERVVIDEDDDDFYSYDEAISGYDADLSSSALEDESRERESEASTVSLSELSPGPEGWMEVLRKAPKSSLFTGVRQGSAANTFYNDNEGKSESESLTERERDNLDYFTLCIAAHFSTVATYVPTDVDSKIRGHCWRDPSVPLLKAQFNVVKDALSWDVTQVSRRTLSIKVPDEFMRDYFEGIASDRVRVDRAVSDAFMTEETKPISGHNGEWFGVLAGAMMAFTSIGEMQLADEAEELILMELHRETLAFLYLSSVVERGVSSHRVRERDPSSSNARHVASLAGSGSTTAAAAAETELLKLCAVMTHNVGDLDQGLSYCEDLESNLHALKKDIDSDKARERDERLAVLKARYGRLAHERGERFQGAFATSKMIYKELLSAEGHRNYPLRESKALRRHPDLMLPLAPWLERWGKLVGSHPGLDRDEKIGVLRQLLRGCDSDSRGWCVPNQVGYYRAIKGMGESMNLELAAKELDKGCQAVLKSHEVRSHLSLSEQAFLGRLAGRLRELIEESRH